MVNVNRALQPIPQRYICKMKYADTFSINLGGASSGVYRFNLNSIYDPNRTGTGHQPYGHDTFQQLYNRYRVVKCTYAIHSISSNNYTIQLAGLPSNEEVSLSTTSAARENPRCRYLIQGNGSPIKTLRGSVYLPSLMGRNKTQYMADDRFQAQFGASPQELAILNVYAGLIGDAAANDEIVCNIELVYTVECFDVHSLAQS